MRSKVHEPIVRYLAVKQQNELNSPSDLAMKNMQFSLENLCGVGPVQLNHFR